MIIIDVMKDCSLFVDDINLWNIEIGVVVDCLVNVDNVKEVGDKIIKFIKVELYWILVLKEKIK